MAKKKFCRRCGRERLLSAFGADRKAKDGLFCWCRDCVKEYHHERDTSEAGRQRARDKYHADPAKARNVALKVKYGITQADYDRLHDQQDGKCAICKRPQIDEGKVLCVDHDHQTGEVRGLLCGPCNRAIGYFDKNRDRLEAVAAYLTTTRNL